MNRGGTKEKRWLGGRKALDESHLLRADGSPPGLEINSLKRQAVEGF